MYLVIHSESQVTVTATTQIPVALDSTLETSLSKRASCLKLFKKNRIIFYGRNISSAKYKYRFSMNDRHLLPRQRFMN